MSWRILHISEQSRLSLRKGSLCVQQVEEHTIPLEDIGVLILESHSISLTTALLDGCVRNKIAVIVCDSTHMPCSVLLGYQQHSRQLKAVEAQLAWTEPFKKRLWQRIIKQKIDNQKTVLEKITNSEFVKLTQYKNTVNSGDTLGREASAARLYFNELLPDQVTRSHDHIINAKLNYGYAILRTVLARSIVAYGFLSSVGIRHKSELNNFNLADDLIEPYRPFVDKFVFESTKFGNGELTKENRIDLVNILTSSVMLDGCAYSLLHALELSAQSLVTASEAKNPELLIIPDLSAC